MAIIRDIGSLQFAPPGRDYVIRQARSVRELDQVHRITHESIVQGGYMAPLPGGRIVSYPELDASPRTTILIATAGRAVIGTNSITADGPLRLNTDRDFPEETARVRAEGRRLNSSFRIATDPSWRTDGGPALVLDLLRWSVFVSLHRYRFETMLCTLNPKHERIYQRLLGARPLAYRDDMGHTGIAAGAVLMRIDVERLPAAVTADMAALAAVYLPSGHRARRSRGLPACLRPAGAQAAAVSTPRPAIRAVRESPAPRERRIDA